MSFTTFRSKPRPRLWVGKKTKEWNRVRARLKKKFAAMEITQCELNYINCTRDNFLSFAHGRKRRHLIGDELETLTCLCCLNCHSTIERLPEAAMCVIVRSVIAEREKQKDFYD